MDSKRSVFMDSNDHEFDGFEPDGGEAIFLSTVLSVMDSKADVTDGLEHHPFDGYEGGSSDGYEVVHPDRFERMLADGCELDGVEPMDTNRISAYGFELGCNLWIRTGAISFILNRS